MLLFMASLAVFSHGELEGRNEAALLVGAIFITFCFSSNIIPNIPSVETQPTGLNVTGNQSHDVSAGAKYGLGLSKSLAEYSNTTTEQINVSTSSNSKLSEWNGYTLEPGVADWVIAACPLGAVIMSIITMFTSNYGAILHLFWSSIFFVFGGLLCALSPNWNVLILGRLFLGAGCEISNAMAPVLVSSFPKRSNGAANSYRNLFLNAYPLVLTFPIFICAMLQYFIPKLYFPAWRIINLITVFVGLVTAIIFKPQNIVDNLITFGTITKRPQRRVAPPQSTEVQLFTSSQKPKSYGSLAASDQAQPTRSESVSGRFDPFKLLFSSDGWWVLLLVCLLQSLHQLSFVNGYFYSSGKIFNNMPEVDIILAGVNVLGALSNVIASHHHRDLKTLGIFSGFGCALGSFSLTAGLISKIAPVQIMGTVIFIASFAFGFGSIPSLIIPQISPKSCHKTLASIGMTVNWSANFLVALLTSQILSALGDYTFVLFGCLCVAFAIIMIIWIPPKDRRTSRFIRYGLHLPCKRNL